MVTIKATDAGFHFLSPIGRLLAPDVYLNMAPYPKGDIALIDAGTLWHAESVSTWPGADIVLETLDPRDPTDGASGFTGVARVAAIGFLRLDGGAGIEIGRIAFDRPLEVSIHRDPDGFGGAPLWRGEAAAALAAAVRAEGIRFEGGAGADVFRPHAPVLPIHGPVTILGGGGDDILFGSLTDDVIRGGAGNDRIESTGGRNLLFGGPGEDMITLGPWSSGSRASGGAGDDRLESSNGGDVLIGNSGDDLLFGGRGSDRLMGGPGNDTLDGGDGNDRIVGGPGSDLLTGGEGADVFVFRAGQPGHDIVTDFTIGEDRLHLLGFGAGLLPEFRPDGEDTLLTWGDAEASVRLLGIGAIDPGGADILVL